MGTSATVILGLIVQYGIPAAEIIYNDVKTWEANKQDPTAADWAALRAKVNKPFDSFFTATPVVPAGTSYVAPATT